MTPYYEQDGITIYHGDYRDVLPFLGSVDLLLTDPMYGINGNTKGASTQRGQGRKLKGCSVISKDWDVIADDQPFDPRSLLSYPEIVLWGANHYASRLPDASCWLVWDKRVGGASDDNADCELAWTNLRGPARLIRHLWRGVIRAGEENIAHSGAKLHPYQKPLEVMRFCLALSRTRGPVWDPFMGSGTTLVAAKQIGRIAIGAEINERYCEIAAERLAQGALPMEFSA